MAAAATAAAPKKSADVDFDEALALLVPEGGISYTLMGLANRYVVSDPPKANADFVTNSVYWLIGRQQYIGSGPAQIRPVTIAPEQMRVPPSPPCRRRAYAPC